jgi:hypothetical protein
MRSTIHLRRGKGLFLAAAVAGLSAALVLLFSAGHSAQAHASTMAAPPQMSAKAVSFVRTMDRLWQDHITWTRMVIVDFAAGLPDLKAAEARLLRNQADIGNAIKPFYGSAAGNKLTQLLRTHILEAVPVLVDAKSGNKPALTKALAAWYANAHQIAQFLAGANPHNWALPAMDTMMKNHLALTTKEAVARITGHWAADIAAYDAVRTEILDMSHMLAMGIIAQFPNRF